MKEVAIVGAGVVSPAGSGVDALWSGLGRAESFAERLDICVDGLPLMGHRVPEGEWQERFTFSERRRLDRFALLGMAAMDEAVDQAGTAWSNAPPHRRVAVAGVGFGGITTLTTQHTTLTGSGWRKLSPFGVASVMASSLVAHATIRLSIEGEALTITSACASGTQALAAGARLIADGSADVVLAGGAEAPLDGLPMASFSRMEAMSRSVDSPRSASRPFDVARGGFVLGEGAAFFVLARSDVVARSDTPVLGTINGWAVTSDAHHPIAPDPSGAGAVRCIRGALESAGLEPSDVVHVNAHGTGTSLNDAAEAAALAAVFGPSSIPVTSVKGALGHLMGAAGAVEAVVTLLSANAGVVPPTVNCEEIDPDLRIDVVTSRRSVPIGPAVTCSFGFGGQNAALVISPRPLRGPS